MDTGEDSNSVVDYQMSLSIDLTGELPVTSIQKDQLTELSATPKLQELHYAGANTRCPPLLSPFSTQSPQSNRTEVTSTGQPQEEPSASICLGSAGPNVGTFADSQASCISNAASKDVPSTTIAEVNTSEVDVQLDCKANDSAFLLTTPNSNSLLSATGKRKYDDKDHSENLTVSPLKTRRGESPPAPANSLSQKKSAVNIHKTQYKKLASPFRSPLLSKPALINATAKNNVAVQNVQHNGEQLAIGTPLKPRSGLSKGTLASSSKVSSPFKSPFSGKSVPSTAKPQNQTSPNVQLLERRIMTLKRAIQIKEDENENKLLSLVKKWRSAGRDAAWELWQIVKDRAQESTGDNSGWGESNGKSFYDSNSWKSWASSADSNQPQSNWGWDGADMLNAEANGEACDSLSNFTPPSPRKLEDEFMRAIKRKTGVERKSILPPTPRGSYFNQSSASTDLTHSVDADEDTNSEYNRDNKVSIPASVGSMLKSLNIAHETLGWNEDEGDFIDDNCDEISSN